MNNSSDRIDVLAAIRAAIAKANAKASGPTRRVQLELHEAEAMAAAVTELIEAAKLSNQAHRLTTRSGSERGDVAEALGLDRFASLDDVRVAARDHLTTTVARVQP